MKLYAFQKRDVKRVAKEPSKGALNASATGVGKTLVGVESMRRSGAQQILIIAPINTFHGWSKTIEQQTGEHLRRVGNYDEMTRLALMAIRAGRPGWFFAGWEWMANQAPIRSFQHVDGLVLDEIHRSSTRDTRTQRMAYSMGRIVEGNGGLRLGLSATPFGNKGAGAWGVMRALWPSSTPRSFHEWANEHLEVQDVVVNQELGTTVRQVGGEITPGQIVRDMPLYFRHEALTRCCKYHPNGVQADLPKRIVHRVEVDITATQRRIYKELEKLWIALPDDSDHAIETQGYAMVLDLRLHQVLLATPTTEMVKIWRKDKETGERSKEDWTRLKYPETAASTKLDAMMEILADIPNGERVLIFTHSRAILNAVVYRINKKFGAGYGVAWHGGVNKGSREAIKKDFTNPKGKVRIIAAQTTSISEGVDGLQLVCWNEIWLSMLNDRKNNIQALGRLMRNGQKRPVQSWQIHAAGTVEEEQYERLEAGQQVMDESLGGLRT